ncbi:MAG: tetraacyldisaccharide 4'-kinase [Bacteroidia bacterium]|nr:tetraacyldisaccharide 4'-kinase [Bacteroidia bacterium]
MRLLKILAFPIALLYGMAIYLRNALYDWSLLRSTEFSTQTISIGNLSVGGTGKTPMIEWLLSQIPDTYKLAVVTRGYGRRSSIPILANPEHTSEEIGDEPKQLISKFPDLCLRVDGDRRRAIQWLETQVKPDIILLDDAHQHRRITPSVAVLLTTYDSLYTEDYFLPTGNLRDSRREARRAACIIITKCPVNMTPEQQQEVFIKIKPEKGQKVFFASLEYDKNLSGARSSSILELKEKPFTLVTGIAQPKPLVNFLRSEGLQFKHIAYPDHHHFSDKEVETFNKMDVLLLTAKDYARLGQLVTNASYIEVNHKFLGNGESEFLDLLGIKKQNASI